MADINFSLDEYIARKSIASPPSGGARGSRGGGATRGGTTRGGTTRGGSTRGASRGGARPSIAARLGSRPPLFPNDPIVKPLMNIGIDARDKLIEKARQGDARDKIIMKNRTKYKDAREKIGHPPQPQPHPSEEQQHFPPAHVNGRNGLTRPHIVGTERLPHSSNNQQRPAPPRPPPPHDHPIPSDMLVEDDLPRRRADARIIGRDNNIIVMAKNDYSSEEPEDPFCKPHQSLRHGNPVVMIKNDRARNDHLPPPANDIPSPPQRYRAPAPVVKPKMVSPRRGDAPIQRRQHPVQRKQPSMEQRLGSPNRDRSPINNGRLSARQPPAHYDSASDGEKESAPPPSEPRRKQISTAVKRSANQTREAPRPEKQPRRSPEPPRNSGRNSAPVATKKSTSILHGIKPVTSSQIPKDTPSEAGDKLSPLQGFRVLVSNLHCIVTQEDVVELFSACGALKRTKMIKAGSAEVVFVKREDAEMAVKKYNNRELDGQPMQCKMATPVKSSLKTNEEPLLGGRLKPAKQPGEGVEATTIHKALFNSAAAAASEKSAKPVVFTVKI